jgi:hypothetical protein
VRRGGPVVADAVQADGAYPDPAPQQLLVVGPGVRQGDRGLRPARHERQHLRPALLGQPFQPIVDRVEAEQFGGGRGRGPAAPHIVDELGDRGVALGDLLLAAGKFRLLPG